MRRRNRLGMGEPFRAATGERFRKPPQIDAPSRYPERKDKRQARQRIPSLAEIDHLISRARHRPGVVAARHAVPLLNERSRSRPESHMRYAIVTAGLPEPAVNVPVFDELGQWLFEPDLGYDDVKLALEYNGSQHAEPSRMRSDISRTIDAGIRGRWRTETFGPVEVFGRPDQLAAYVRYLREARRAS